MVISQKKALIVCMIASVVLHVVVAWILVLPFIVSLFEPRHQPEIVEEKVESEIVLRFQAAPKSPTALILKPKPKTDEVAKRKKRFSRTDASQQEGVPDQTDRIGDRDTVARSDAPTKAGSPDRASVRGEKRDREESTNSNKQDGNLEHEAIAKQPQPAQPESSMPPLTEEAKPKVEAVPNVAQSPEKKDLLEQKDKVAVTESAEERAKKIARGEKLKREKEQREEEERRRKDELAKLEAEKEAERERKAEEERRRLAEVKSSKSGFKPSVRSAETMGSISRRGKASQNVKATPTGRYTSEVIKRVGKEWYRRCRERSDLLLPGSLTMGWFVHEDGRITGLEVKSERNGGDIQKGITVQSINSAKAPPMPKSVKDELNGDPLYIQINFEF